MVTPGNADLVPCCRCAADDMPIMVEVSAKGTNCIKLPRVAVDVPSLVGNWAKGVRITTKPPTFFYIGEGDYAWRHTAKCPGTPCNCPRRHRYHAEPVLPVVGEFYQVQALIGGSFQSITGALIHYHAIDHLSGHRRGAGARVVSSM